MRRSHSWLKSGRLRFIRPWVLQARRSIASSLHGTNATRRKSPISSPMPNGRRSWRRNARTLSVLRRGSGCRPSVRTLGNERTDAARPPCVHGQSTDGSGRNASFPREQALSLREPSSKAPFQLERVVCRRASRTGRRERARSPILASVGRSDDVNLVWFAPTINSAGLGKLNSATAFSVIKKIQDAPTVNSCRFTKKMGYVILAHPFG